MGYHHTSYTIEVHKLNESGSLVPHEQESEVIEAIQNSSEDALMAIDAEGYPSDACSWPHWQEDLEGVSALYPNAVISLKARGEDHDDHFMAYVLNGNTEEKEATIHWPPYTTQPNFTAHRPQFGLEAALEIINQSVMELWEEGDFYPAADVRLASFHVLVDMAESLRTIAASMVKGES